MSDPSSALEWIEEIFDKVSPTLTERLSPADADRARAAFRAALEVEVPARYPNEDHPYPEIAIEYLRGRAEELLLDIEGLEAEERLGFALGMQLRLVVEPLSECAERLARRVHDDPDMRGEVREEAEGVRQRLEAFVADETEFAHVPEHLFFLVGEGIADCNFVEGKDVRSLRLTQYAGMKAPGDEASG